MMTIVGGVDGSPGPDRGFRTAAAKACCDTAPIAAGQAWRVRAARRRGRRAAGRLCASGRREPR